MQNVDKNLIKFWEISKELLRYSWGTWETLKSFGKILEKS